MNLRKKLVRLVFLVIVLAICVYVLPGYIPFYNRYIFYPFQSFRGSLLGWLPFSIGDAVYIVCGALLLCTVVRWVYFITRFSINKNPLAASVLNTINAALFGYIFFIAGWGANYAKRPLREHWHFPATDYKSRAEARTSDSLSLIAFDKFLVEKLNTCAPHYRALSFDDINTRAKAFYRSYTDSKVKMHGLSIKRSMFGYFMERVAVDGYYNPFTGERQVNGRLPAFILPFVVSHEMAHQAGIAAEGDANLMAYAIGTQGNDAAFNYSSYLNIWLYVNNRLYRRDSATAKKLEAQLNKLTTAHIDTLEELSKKYNNEVSKYSSGFYDTYLKINKQKEGIRSYSNVTTSAWQLEQERMAGRRNRISIP